MHKKLILLPVLLILFISCNNFSDKNSKFSPIDNPTSAWKEIVSDSGNYRIKFPNYKIDQNRTEYVNDSNELQIANGYKLNLQEEDNLNIGYSISYIDRFDIETDEEIDNFFIDQKKYLTSVFDASLEYDKVLKNKPYPGRELYFTIDSSNLKMTYRIYSKNNKIYLLQVLTDTKKGKAFNKSIAKFMDSFETLDESVD